MGNYKCSEGCRYAGICDPTSTRGRVMQEAKFRQMLQTFAYNISKQVSFACWVWKIENVTVADLCGHCMVNEYSSFM